MRFVIFKGQNQQWYWHLLSSNNQIVAAGGEGYTTKENCLHSIGLVMDTNRQTPVYER